MPKAVLQGAAALARCHANTYDSPLTMISTHGASMHGARPVVGVAYMLMLYAALCDSLVRLVFV